MATNRGTATPASPTLTRTTDDAARGGLFNSVEEANISSSDVSIGSVTVGEGNITMSITINGDTQTQTFNVNQTDNSTESFSFNIDTGSNVDDTNTFVMSGSLSSDNNTLNLVLSDGTPVQGIDVTNLNMNTQRTDAEINTLADARIAAATLVRTVNNDAPDASGNVNVTSTVDLTAFEDSASVDFVAGTTDPNDISAVASPAWMGNSNNGGLTGTVNITRLNLAANTGLILVATDAANGIYTLQTAGANPTPPEESAPAPTSALAASPELTSTITATNGGTFAMDSDVTGVVARNSAGDRISGVTSMIAADRRTVDITIPPGGANAPDTYTFSATTTTTSVDGVRGTPMMSSASTVRYIPFFQSRNDIMQTTDLTTVTASDAAWPGEFTAIAGTGAVFLAALSTDLASTLRFAADAGGFRTLMSFRRAITVTLADSTTRTFNVFRIPVRGGTTLTTFT